MSVPTNNLYNFVTQALENKFLIKYFYPWGEKGFKNIIDNQDDFEIYDKLYNKLSVVLCHDQEPLDFDMYSDDFLLEQLPDMTVDTTQDLAERGYQNLNLNLRWHQPYNWTNYWVLLHSELNSPEVIKYESTGLFKCAYWWAHAPIAIDWYRFAQYDNRLKRQSENIKANFLVYARATTGKRAYRNLFLEQIKYFKNIQLGSFKKYEVTGDSSAIYDPYDFAHTNCSIVLETVYDRIHLTEKTLRPIACGHPFLLLNGAGALEKIREYGFKTFQPYINESYDKEEDPVKRMDMLLSEMNRINSSSKKYQQWIWKGCQEIADYNKRLFFDDKFLWRVKTELRRNVHTIPLSKLTHHIVRRLQTSKTRKEKLEMNQEERVKTIQLYLRLKRASI